MGLLLTRMKVGRSNHRKRPKRRLQVTQAWREDLEIDISEGWTGTGQTNALLKTIACYGVVFEQLQGSALEEYVLRIATTRPGYEQYCGHKEDIQRRINAWVRAAESYYWPLGSEPKRQGDGQGPDGIPFNQRLSDEAQERIKSAVEQLKQLGQLPDMITARAQAIALQGGIAMRTLYKNLTLWHPHHQEEPAQVEIPQPEGIPETLEPPETIEPDLPKPLQNKEFPTSPQSMKGGVAPQGDAGSEKQRSDPNRGVWGDELRSPQVAEPEPLYFLDDLAQGCRRQLQRLGWNAAQLVQFIADRFDGKRRAQLSDDELVSLLYQLQTLDGG
jgi:hypothetical protein